MDRFPPAEAWCTGRLTGLVAALPAVACPDPLFAVALARATGAECVGVRDEL